jgi:hypothetical protein
VQGITETVRRSIEWKSHWLAQKSCSSFHHVQAEEEVDDDVTAHSPI